VKRRDLEKRMRRHGCSLKREGGNHSIWHNPEGGGATVPVPRHSEIADVLARKICKDLGIPPP
jgi:mRNA interferase HicA